MKLRYYRNVLLIMNRSILFNKENYNFAYLLVLCRMFGKIENLRSDFRERLKQTEKLI